MKTGAIQLFSITLSFMFAVTSCRNKEDIDLGVSDSEVALSQSQVADNSDATSNIDDAIDNINTSVATYYNSARLETTTICGFSADYSNFSSNKTIVFTYNSATCNERSREGTITVQLVNGPNFGTAGAIYTLDFDAFGVTKNGKKMTLTGVQTVTNVSGGLARQLTSGSSVTHTITGQMQLNFEGTLLKRTWNINRTIVWTNTEGVYSISISSANTVDGFSNVSVWGTNRNGNMFYTQLLTPITANSTCGWYRPTAGERLHTVKDADGTTLFTAMAVVNVGTDGCGNGFTITTKNKKGKVRVSTFTY